MKKSFWSNYFLVLIILATEVLILNILVVGSNLFFLIIGFQFSLCIAGNKIIYSDIGDGDVHTYKVDSVRLILEISYNQTLLLLN